MQVFAMEVDASFRYWGGVEDQFVVGGWKVEKERDVIEVGCTEGRKEWERNFTRPLGCEMKRSRVRSVIEVSAPATAMACWSMSEGEEASRRETARAVADLIFLWSFLRSVTMPDISSKRRVAPVPFGLFWRTRRVCGLRKRRHLNLGRALLEVLSG